MKISILKSPPFNFDYLKRLKIGRVPVIDLDVINKFTRLEELDIDMRSYKKKNGRTLSLANLKVIYLFMSDHLSCLKLDTPLLAKVCTFDLKKLEFFFPESVQCIHTFAHRGKLSMFRNLEYLTFTDYYNILKYSHDLLFDDFSVTDLKKLKEIHFYYHSKYYEDRNMSNFKETISNILSLRRPDLKVFWQNLQVTDPSLLTEYDRTVKNDESQVIFQLQHYEMIREKDHFFWSYHFNSSMRELSEAGFNLRSEEFTSKFLSAYSFRRINVTDRAEEWELSLLLELIARSSDLFALRFGYIYQDQSFYDRMADIVRMNRIPLQQLQVLDTLSESLNFDFVTRLPHLQLFETDRKNLGNELISRLFDSPMLAEIRFGSWFFCERIERMSKSRYRLNGKSMRWHKLLKKLNQITN